jgi:mitotic spindle assembly checkpoint protein MAD2B
MSTQSPTYRRLVAAWSDFLTVAIHTYLYERALYPRTSFISARKYNFAVRQNRHPKVCEWINDAVDAVEAEMLKSTVDRVAIVVYSKQNKPLERVVFDVSRFPTVPPADLDVPLERVEADGAKADVLPTVDLEEQLRATMARLSNCGADMKPLPAECTFSIAIELKVDGEPPLNHPQPWIPVQGKGKGVAAERYTKPLRTVTAGELTFETWIEELHHNNPLQRLSQSFAE